MTTIHTASRQWATRPADERFTSLTELNDFTHLSRERSKSKVLSSRQITAQPVEGDNKALIVVGPNGGPVNLTHWSFGQLAQRASAPQGYLRNLPAPLAADCINYGLHVERSAEDIGVLLNQNGGPAELRAVTGPNYGRIWNATITQALVDRFGDGITGDFRVPGEFGKDVVVDKNNTTLYASDRDFFVFLADEKNRIEIPNRRNGQAGSLARGFFVWNSEVGATSLGVATFLFDYVCCNRIVWGATQYGDIRPRHTASAPDRWVEEVAPSVIEYANSSSAPVITTVLAAQKAKVGDVDDFLAKRFSRAQSAAIKAAHLSDEQRPIETLWDVATGVTAYARSLSYQDARVDLEREAGKVLDLATK